MTNSVYWKSILRTVVALSALWAGAGCSREPEQKSLTAVAYNYSETSFGRILVNGKWASPPLEKVKDGVVQGGASICCVRVDKDAKTARVKVTFIDGDYIVDAPIEQPWPPKGYGHYLAIHVLPKREVKLSVMVGYPAPRFDLLQTRFKALEISGYTIDNADMWDQGPEQYVDDEKDGE